MSTPPETLSYRLDGWVRSACLSGPAIYKAREGEAGSERELIGVLLDEGAAAAAVAGLNARCSGMRAELLAVLDGLAGVPDPRERCALIAEALAEYIGDEAVCALVRRLTEHPG